MELHPVIPPAIPPVIPSGIRPVIPPPRGGPVLAGIGAALLDLAVGSRCLLCRLGGGLCCPWCRDRLDQLVREAPVGIAAHVAAAVGLPVHASVPYQPPLASLFVSYKEHGALSLTPVLGGLLGAAVARAVAPSGRLTLVPVPSRPGAGRSRGHEATLVLARRAARVLRPLGGDVQVLPVLRSSRGVLDQTGLDAGQRRRNLAGSMSPRPRFLARLLGVQGRVVLVDDIVTTGATLSEAVRALNEVGVQVSAAATAAATPVRSRRTGPR